MKKCLQFLGLMIGCFLVLESCDCGNVNCPGVSAENKARNIYKLNDTIIFENDLGNRIVFKVDRIIITNPETRNCFKNNNGINSNCNCSVCENKQIYVSMNTFDTSRFNYDSTYKRKLIENTINFHLFEQNDSIKSTDLYISVFGSGLDNKIVENKVIPKANDSVYALKNIGNKIYDSVYVRTIDTTSINYFSWKRKLFTYKIYHNKTNGIIAFFDRQTNSLFYRKW